jgi:hypothetical protein
MFIYLAAASKRDENMDKTEPSEPSCLLRIHRRRQKNTFDRGFCVAVAPAWQCYEIREVQARCKQEITGELAISPRCQADQHAHGGY